MMAMLKNSNKIFDIFDKLDFCITMNCILCDKQKCYIVRYINNNEEPASLYHNNNKTIFSSEPLSDDYIVIPNKSIHIIEF